MGIKHHLAGWEASNLDFYYDAFHKYGGSVNTHPDIVKFHMRKSDDNVRFWHYSKDGEIKAAYFTANKTLGIDIWSKYPLSFDEVIMPFSPEQKLIIPEKTKRLSIANQKNVINSLFILSPKRKVCIAKENFSAKTIKKRNGELKKFISLGGEIQKINDLSPKDIAQLYVYLFKKRFKDTVKCYEDKKISEFLSSIPNMISGNALFFNGKPCAMDIVLAAESKSKIYFDVPNGGLDPDLSKLSPGSLLMWSNIKDARERCESESKEMTFCIGAYSKKWDYKLLWADKQRTGRVFTV